MKVLLLEDDAVLADILLGHLEGRGYNVLHVDNGEDALTSVEDGKFDLLIFDINVPLMSGLEVVKTLREYKNMTPAIIVTAYQDTSYLKEGFESGCDDYIKKPFDLEELDLRIENLMRRFSIESEEEIKLGENSTLYPSKNRLVSDGKIYTLAHKECEILTYLNARRGRVISSEELMQNLWEYESMPSDATIRVYIKNLRNILGKDKIKTIRGSGYYFER